MKTLLFGIGNSGRSDDGLGWEFLDKIKPNFPIDFDMEYRYQLQIEDAELAKQYQRVMFSLFMTVVNFLFSYRLYCHNDRIIVILMAFGPWHVWHNSNKDRKL